MSNLQREPEWAAWMKAALAGDEAAYRRVLEAIAPYLRALARRRCAQFGATSNDVEDIVQETLLAIHLKRGTWDPSRPIGPWISAIAANKVIDSLRRRGRRSNLAIEDVMDTLIAEESVDSNDSADLEHILGRLKTRDRQIVQAVSVDSLSAREAAARLGMSEGAVRVALHRALKALAAIYRSERE